MFTHLVYEDKIIYFLYIFILIYMYIVWKGKHVSKNDFENSKLQDTLFKALNSYNKNIKSTTEIIQ